MAQKPKMKLNYGDVFYSVFETQIIKHRYVGPHPSNDNFHIVIGDNEKPFTWYIYELEDVLALGLKTYKQALKESIRQQEIRLINFKKYLEEKEGHG